MREYDVQQLINDKEFLQQKINTLLQERTLFQQKIDKEEIQGHILKAENNLRFIAENIKLNFLDWSITGCYYACYHAALALILTRGYTSKSHIATLCVMIKEFYKKEVSIEDIKLLVNFLDYQDVLFYVESKQQREKASYSTKITFQKQEVEQLRLQAIVFVNKIKNIIKETQ